MKDLEGKLREKENDEKAKEIVVTTSGSDGSISSDHFRFIESNTLDAAGGMPRVEAGRLGFEDFETVEAVEALREIDDLQFENWYRLREIDKVGVLQQAENRLAELQRRSPAEVLMVDCEPNVYGGYNYGTNQIEISSHLLRSNDVKEVVDTIAHEGRHAYQYQATMFPEIHHDRNEVREWRKNFFNYMRQEDYGYELYRSQPLEADAWKYGKTIAEGLYGRLER